MIRLRRMRWMGHVARIAEKKNAYKLLVARAKEITRNVRFEVFHSSDYEECHLLGCYTIWIL
jgi:hypothetical protein